MSVIALAPRAMRMQGARSAGSVRRPGPVRSLELGERRVFASRHCARAWNGFRPGSDRIRQQSRTWTNARTWATSACCALGPGDFVREFGRLDATRPSGPWEGRCANRPRLNLAFRDAVPRGCFAAQRGAAPRKRTTSAPPRYGCQTCTLIRWRVANPSEGGSVMAKGFCQDQRSGSTGSGVAATSSTEEYGPRALTEAV